jgi:hypothetical protein
VDERLPAIGLSLAQTKDRADDRRSAQHAPGGPTCKG